MIYGTPAVHIVNDTTDRIGIRLLILSKLWQPTRWPMPPEELRQQTPETPEVEGGLEFIGRQTQPDGGGLRTLWTFEGIDGDGKSVTFKDRDKSTDYSFTPGFSQKAIESHPKFFELREKYGGYADGDGKTVWPDTLANPGSGFQLRIGLGAGGTDGAKARNPMFSIEDFLRMEGTYSFRYASRSLSGAESGVSKIHKTGKLPGSPPNYSGQDWLKAPSPFQRRGPVNEITEIYWLSGPGGWPNPVYE